MGVDEVLREVASLPSESGLGPQASVASKDTVAVPGAAVLVLAG